MKKLLKIFVLFIIIIGLHEHIVVQAEISPIVVINGQQVYFEDVQPVIQGGRTLIPVRGVFEKMGCDVEWNGDKRTVRVQRSAIVVALQIENPSMTIGKVQSDGTLSVEKIISLDVSPCLINGRTMLPARAVAECLGAKVEWVEQSQTVLIYDESITSGTVVSGTHILWTDIGVEQCVRYILNKPFGEITIEECDNIYYLDLRGYNVRTIQDLKYFKHLSSLYVSDVNRLDISPLSELIYLQELSVTNCDIYDLRPISCLYELKYLYMEDNLIEDLSPLSHLTELQILGLDRNNLHDVLDLSNMYNLRELYIDDNPISDISCIASIINELDFLSVDVDYLDFNRIDYRITSEFDELISYVNYQRYSHGLKNIILNDPYISYYLLEYGEYRKEDNSGAYINMLSQKYNARAVFRQGLLSNYMSDYENIIEWMEMEYMDILNKLLTAEYGDSEIYVSMHYEQDILVMEMAFGD